MSEVFLVSDNIGLEVKLLLSMNEYFQVDVNYQLVFLKCLVEDGLLVFVGGLEEIEGQF